MKDKQALQISNEIKGIVKNHYGNFFYSISNVSADKITDDVLSAKKIDEQVQIIQRFSKESIEGKKILEIGSGFGIFVILTNKFYKADSYGVEPGSVGFGGSFELSEQILKENNVNSSRVKEGVGEALPYADNYFDIVYSTNVLEHVNDPAKVISEAIRVCKPGGFIQIVFPSYGSFYDGHYACMYIPYQPKWLWIFYVKYILRKDPSFAKTIRTELNYFSIKKILKPYLLSKKIKLISTGEEVFVDRMTTLKFTPYAGLTKIMALVQFMHKIKLVKLATWFLLIIKAHSPLIISIRKT